MRSLLLCLVGSGLNAAVLSIPVWLHPGGGATLADSRFWVVVVVLSLWIACDQSVPSKPLSLYRDVKVRELEASYFPYLSGAIVLAAVWISIGELVLRSPSQAGTFWSLLGLGLCLLGLVVRYSAIRTLGHFFTEQLVVLRSQPLVTDGPFRWIRHPSYSGLVLILLGLVMFLSSTWGVLFLAVVVLPMVLVRVAQEERALRRGLGDAYLEYCSRTKRLVPLLY